MSVNERIKKEFEELQNNPILALGASIGLENEDDYTLWNVTLVGPKETPYHNGLFYLTIQFPPDFPKTKPEVRFKNHIYHLNVLDIDDHNYKQPPGHVCINTLNNWNEKTSMIQVISDIFALFFFQNPDSSYYPERAEEYRNDKTKFNKNAQEWTKKYASMF